MSGLASRGLFAAMFAMYTVTSALSHFRQDHFLLHGARVPLCTRYSVGFQICRQVSVGEASVAVWTQQSIRREGCAEDLPESRKVERLA
eukprot:13309355-Alexandrium_andersonii.AAC.1